MMLFLNQEPVSVALAAPILDIQFHGWISFFILVYYSLPVMPNQKTYYEYTGLWHIYGFMSMNIWLWCAVFLTRDVEFTEKLYCSSYVAWLGFTLILSTLRAFDIRDRAARIMIALLVISFVATHILYLNFYSFDKGLNTKVNTLMITVQMLIWVIWVGLSRHPSRWSSNVARGSHSSWVFVVEFCKGPLLKDDAMFRTSSQLKEAK